MPTDRIVYFGDSLTDGGTVFSVTSQILAIPFPLTSAGYAEVFSNGPVYSQRAPALLGIPVVENYAVGGATALQSRAITELGGGLLDPLILPGAPPELLNFDVDFGGQIGRFLTDEAADPFDGTTTASILIGLNDLSGFTPTTADPVAEGTALVNGIVTTTIGAAQQLVTLGGVDEIIFYTYPDATFFPFSQLVDPALLPLAELLFQGHADGLAQGADLLNAAGIATRVIGLDQITDEIAADGATFGFLSQGPYLFGIATDPQIDPGTGLPFFPVNPAVAGLELDQIAFYDFLHPTTALHGVFAAFTNAWLTEERAFLDDGANRYRGSGADEFVLARDGDDRLFLKGGDDLAFAGLGNDLVWGGRGDDIVAGGAGDDKLFGSTGSDVLAGNLGDDRVFGGWGADALTDGLGSDYLNGGFVRDTFFYADAALIGGVSGADRDVFVGGWGRDTLYLAVSDDNRAATEAEIAQGGGWFHHYQFDALGLTTYGIENVVFVDSRADFDDVSVTARLQDNLDEAELWGLI